MIRVLVDGGGHAGARVPELKRAVRAACRHAGVEEGEFSVALLDDAGITHLNRTHLGHDRPTDVIAFALYGPGEPVLGDVYLGVEQAARQAAEEGVTLREELVRLAVHGALHVLGFDHPEDARQRASSPMYLAQEELVREVLAGRRR